MASSNPYFPQSGLSATGLFNAVVNNVGDFDDVIVGDLAFNATLLDAAGVVGKSTNPYLPSLLPAYIPTLYKNVFDIQSNLTNEISLDVDVSDNRTYPTSFAVATYVQARLGGAQVLDASFTAVGILGTIPTTFLNYNGVLSTQTVNTGNLYTPISGGVGEAHFDFLPITNESNGSKILVVNLYPIDNLNKVSIIIDPSGGSQGGTNTPDLSLTNRYFSVNGKAYKKYTFSSPGDNLQVVQFTPDASNTSSQIDVYLVMSNSFGGVFTSEVEYPTPYNNPN